MSFWNNVLYIFIYNKILKTNVPYIKLKMMAHDKEYIDEKWCSAQCVGEKFWLRIF